VTTNLAELLPLSRLPRTNYPAGKEVHWLYDTEREKYRQTGGHPLYGEADIVYRFNSLGYRCPEFDERADVRIVAIGCSYVLGQALPQSAVFPEVFAERLRAAVSPRTVVVWNLGLSGASNDYISRLLELAVPLLKPDVVLINFTHLARREYVTVTNKYVNYNPPYLPEDPVMRETFRHFAALASPLDDLLNFYRNYKAIACRLAGVQWLFSHPYHKEIEPLAQHLDLRRYAGVLQPIDKARDHGHPGPESHRRLAELYWDRFTELGGLPAERS
jgi:hypothetical protein